MHTLQTQLSAQPHKAISRPVQLKNPHNSRLVKQANAVLAHRHRLAQPAAAGSLAALLDRWGAKPMGQRQEKIRAQ